jgi:hypothetical protein
MSTTTTSGNVTVTLNPSVAARLEDLGGPFMDAAGKRRATTVELAPDVAAKVLPEIEARREEAAGQYEATKDRKLDRLARGLHKLAQAIVFQVTAPDAGAEPELEDDMSKDKDTDKTATPEAPAPEAEAATAEAPAVDPTEVVSPEAPGTELVIPEGRALDIWADSDAAFVPALKRDMLPEVRRETVRNLCHKATMADDRLQLVAGELLYEVHRNQYWKEWTQPNNQGEAIAFPDFDAYCENELGMRRRKAEYLIGVYAKFVVELDLPKELLRDLEWTKARELVTVITADNAEGLLDKIKGMTYKEVRDMVRTMKGGGTAGETDAEKMVTLTFRLHPDQAENVNRAIEIAQGMGRSDKTGYALDLICLDFVGSAAGATPDAALVSLGVLIKHVERAYGVELEVKSIDKDRYDSGKAEEAPAVAE